MKSSTLLQLFLLLDTFIMGALAAVAARHAYAHFRPPEPEPEKPHATNPVVHLPPAVREQMLAAAQTNFKTVLDRSTTELQHDLETTTGQLSRSLEKIGSEVVGKEMERYQTTLEALRKQTETSIVGATTEIAEHQTALKAQLEQEITTEKQRLIDQIDTKLADAVASFLMEALQHNVDLGAQSAYLTAMLDEHKDDFKREVGMDEAQPAK